MHTGGQKSVWTERGGEPPTPGGGGRGRREEDFYGLLGGGKRRIEGREGGRERQSPLPAIRGQGWNSTMLSKEKKKTKHFFYCDVFVIHTVR